MATHPTPAPSFPLDLRRHIDADVMEAVARATVETPPKLAEAMRYAVAPGGGRVRPQLARLVASVGGDRDPDAARAAAVAVELVHCASLVHDDLPCFDDAELRRGKPALHRVFGEPIALLVGDALIVLAFETLATVSSARALVVALSRGIGASRGIIAGQAWESESNPPLEAYHAAKTGALFAAASAMGAIAAGARPEPWRAFGQKLGAAYQAADDLADASGDVARLGKSTGRDAALERPSVVRIHGADHAKARVAALARDALAALPPGAEAIREWVEHGALDRLGVTVPF